MRADGGDGRAASDRASHRPLAVAALSVWLGAGVALGQVTIPERNTQEQREEQPGGAGGEPTPRILPEQVDESTTGGLRMRRTDEESRQFFLNRQRRMGQRLQNQRQGQGEAPAGQGPIGIQPAGEDGEGGVLGAEGVEALEEDEFLVIPPLPEPFQLSALVDLIADALDINLTVPSDGIRGSIAFNSPLRIRRDKLLEFLGFALDQEGYGITLDEEINVYVIKQTGELPRNFTGDLATTRVLRVPNLLPSSLEDSINSVLGVSGGSGGGGGSTGGRGTARVAFVDELGLVVITGSSRQIELVENYIGQLRERYSELKLYPIELNVLAASEARDRILSLVGGSARSGGGGGGNAQAQGGGSAGSIAAPEAVGLENLAARLFIDPQGNALLFRGTEDELDLVRAYVARVDRPVELKPRRFFAGRSARQIAEIARQRGLGEVVELESDSGQGGLQQGGAAQAGSSGGPTMVVNVQTGQIIYYGTEQQQEVLADLINELETEQDRIVIREYRLDNADAEEVAGIVQSLIEGQNQAAESTLLPQQRAGTQTAQGGGDRFRGEQDGGLEGEIGAIDPNQVFVVPDQANNQIIVKAPLNQQSDLRELIRRLDRRRPQVWIDATIVSVSDSDAFQLAIEATNFNLGEFAIANDFGLASQPDTITGLPTVSSAGSGVTAAILQSSFVPFVLNTLRTRTDAQIISQPQLLANDNEEATIASVTEQPTTQTTIGNTSEQVSFQGFEEAGTTLTVTPSIAESGHVRLEYSVEFSDFIGSPTTDGIPAPRSNQNVQSSVTIPSDATIVVGGIVVRDVTNASTRIPLLGEIPLLEYLFGTTSRNTSETILYIFITPRVLADPNFNDLKLLTRGPRALTGKGAAEAPPLEPRFIELGDAVGSDRPSSGLYYFDEDPTDGVPGGPLGLGATPPGRPAPAPGSDTPGPMAADTGGTRGESRGDGEGG